jgi:MerC mercury resistance protein
MAAIGRLFDTAAIGLSSLCIAHCLLFPLAVAALPVLGQALPGGAAIHAWLLFATFVISGPALWMGYRAHRQWVPFAVGLAGAAFLGVGLFLFHAAIGETIATVIGAGMLAYAHIRNAALRHQAATISG